MTWGCRTGENTRYNREGGLITFLPMFAATMDGLGRYCFLCWVSQGFCRSQLIQKKFLPITVRSAQNIVHFEAKNSTRPPHYLQVCHPTNIFITMRCKNIYISPSVKACHTLNSDCKVLLQTNLFYPQESFG